MKILVVPSEEFLPPDVPLSGIFERDQALALQSRGHEVGVLSIRMEGSLESITKQLLRSRELRLSGADLYRSMIRTARSPLLAEEKRGGLSVAQVCVSPVRSPGSLRSRELARDAGWLGVQKYVDRCGTPDVVHAHNALSGGTVALEVHRRLGVPFIVTEHSTAWSRGVVTPELVAVARSVFDAASERITVSPYLGDILRGHGVLSRSISIPNVVDSLFLEHPLGRSSGLQSDKVCFLNVGNLVEHKGQRDLIEAFALLCRASALDCRLRFLGDGPLRGALAAYATQHNLGQRVEFLGQLGRESVAEEMARSSCVVISSWQETFGVVAIEAMAMGVPVITTACGGPEFVVSEKTGDVVARRDPAELAQAMGRMLSDRGRFDAASLRLQAQRLYGADHVGRQLEAVLTRTIGSAASGMTPGTCG